MEGRFARELEAIPAARRPSARNLLHYLAMRGHDLRPLQSQLAALGLSSLGRCEAHVMATLDAVAVALAALAGDGVAPEVGTTSTLGFQDGPKRLAAQTRALFGSPSPGRATTIMVTMPREAADDPALIERMVGAGMNVMRINCAHDDAIVWRALVTNLRRAERKLGRRCRVLVDLAGPKLRTGPIESEPRVIKIPVTRDERGQLRRPTLVWLRDAGDSRPTPAEVDVVLPMSDLTAVSKRARVVRLCDLRGKHRELKLRRRDGRSWLAEAEQTAYVGAGVEASFIGGSRHPHVAQVADLGVVAKPIGLAPGDHLVLTRLQTAGRPAHPTRPRDWARVPCSLPEVFNDVRVGERVFVDDGKLGAVVVRSDGDEIELEVRQAPPGGFRLLPDKGLNFPDSRLRVSGLTAKDCQDLEFAERHADLVGLSFAQRAEDVIELGQRLRTAGNKGLVLKIETDRGFQALPALLLAGMRFVPLGVMVARGDLGVEVGFERLAEVQEEILWLSEAAHVPAVWATQVLESLTKRGAPSRAEVTDSAMAVRAECVMLNKGPFVVEAVSFLDDVLRRMGAHQRKKAAQLRRLAVAGRPVRVKTPRSPAIVRTRKVVSSQPT